MFTGIIKKLGVVKDISENSLTIKTECKEFLNIDLGTSVAVDGVCLTAVSYTHLTLPTTPYV